MKPKSHLITFLLLGILSVAVPMETLGQGKDKKGPPPWAPAHGYRAKTRHVYFPQYNFYFDLQRGVYIYLSGSTWQVAAKLPASFAEVDLKGAVQVELDLDTDTPQKYNSEHKVKFKVKDEKAKTRTGSGEKEKTRKK
jgi:hypothetical protein